MKLPLSTPRVSDAWPRHTNNIFHYTPSDHIGCKFVRLRTVAIFGVPGAAAVQSGAEESDQKTCIASSRQ